MTQRILVLSDCHEHTRVLKQSLCGGNFDIDSKATSSDELRKLAAKRPADIIVVIKKRYSIKTMEIIRQIMREHPVPVVIFTQEGNEESASTATQAGVSAYVIDGLREDRIKPILTAAVMRFKETQKLKQKLNKAQTDLKERKLIERAKGLLMKQRSCSEDDAYTALRSLAMKQHKRLSEIAEGVINTSSLMA